MTINKKIWGRERYVNHPCTYLLLVTTRFIFTNIPLFSFVAFSLLGISCEIHCENYCILSE